MIKKEFIYVSIPQTEKLGRELLAGVGVSLLGDFLLTSGHRLLDTDVPLNVPVNERQQWFSNQLEAGENIKNIELAILIKTQTDLEHISRSHIQPTATTVFSRYDLRIMTRTGYYFHTRRMLSVDDHIIHTILIDPLNPIINSYAAALIMRSGTKDLLKTGRCYDIDEHVTSLLEYLRIQEKNSDHVLPWNEYMDIFNSLVVR